MTDPSPVAPVRFRLPADVSLPQVAALRDELLAALDTSDNLELDATDVEHVDFTFFQMMCATHRECVERGKVVTLEPRHPHIVDAMKRAGFCRARGCAPGCLWAEVCHE